MRKSVENYKSGYHMNSDQHKDLEEKRSRVYITIIDCEHRIRRALGRSPVDRKTIERDLEAFYNLHDSNSYAHHIWIHRLAHFLGALYEQRLISWANPLTAKAFEGEKQLSEWDNCYQVAVCFAYHAQWDDAPSESSLTPQNVKRLIWPDSHLEAFCKARICISPFESEVVFQRWQLLHPQVISRSNSDLQCSVLPIEKIKTMVASLENAGYSSEELYRIKSVLLAYQADEIGCFFGDWSKRQIRKRIEVFKDLLACLLSGQEGQPNKMDAGAT